MVNPFLKRATEFFRDEEAFLAIVSPDPVRYFLAELGRSGALYDRLALIQGTPGSGKTTMGRLFEYATLATLLRHKGLDSYSDLMATMTECGAVRHNVPAVVGYRLPLETDYRDFWEFPYSEDVKLGLMARLIQARAVLGWARNLESAGVELGEVEIVARADAEAATEAIGGTGMPDIVDKARAVEATLYRIISALVPPGVGQLDEAATGAYRPFDVIDKFVIPIGDSTQTQRHEIIPLIILDDAHVLHPRQFRYLQHWLVRRELRVARWILTRLDVLHPGEALAVVAEQRHEPVDLPGVTKTRDISVVLLQGGSAEGRRKERTAFRRMAKDMADRYLRQMPLFSQRGHTSLSSLLIPDPEDLSRAKLKDLDVSVRAVRKRLRITDDRYAALQRSVDGYSVGRAKAEDIRLAMTRILMHRYAKRIPGQQFLFDSEDDPEPKKPLKVDASTYHAARIHLFHEYERPYYFGMDDLCDASSENAEQFLRLAAVLVESSATEIIRSRRPALVPKRQHHLLREKAGEIIRDWSFPECHSVRRLTGFMGTKCLEISRLPNAPLGAGANAFGILQDEFEGLHERFPELARVLQFAIAYNALSIVPRYPCKKQEWCLLELGGMVILHHGLTLSRGGFIESSATELARFVEQSAQ